jgi:hypothetical protein
MFYLIISTSLSTFFILSLIKVNYFISYLVITSNVDINARNCKFIIGLGWVCLKALANGFYICIGSICRNVLCYVDILISIIKRILY